MECFTTDFHYDLLCHIEDKVCQTAHHDEQHEHDPPRQFSGKRTIVFLILHLYGPYILFTKIYL